MLFFLSDVKIIKFCSKLLEIGISWLLYKQLSYSVCWLVCLLRRKHSPPVPNTIKRKLLTKSF